MINSNLINNSHFPEREMLRLFKGTCEAVRAMHDYRAPLSSSSNPFPGRTNQSTSSNSHPTSTSNPNSHPRLSGELNSHPRLSGERQALNPTHSGADHGIGDDEDDEDMFPHPEGDSEGGYSYHGSGGKSGRSSAVPLMTKHRAQDEGETIYDGDEELARIQREGGRGHEGETELVPYAHRDLKPGYACVPFSSFHITRLFFTRSLFLTVKKTNMKLAFFFLSL